MKVSPKPIYTDGHVCDGFILFVSEAPHVYAFTMKAYLAFRKRHFMSLKSIGITTNKAT